MSDKQKFFELLKYSNELNQDQKSLRKEDYAAFELLLNFLVTIEINFHYSEKKEYIKIANNFLANNITAEDFSIFFMGIYEGINQKLHQMQKTESLELANFLKPSSRELGNLLARIYGSCDSFLDPELTMSTEQELKDCAQILLLKLQEQQT